MAAGESWEAPALVIEQGAKIMAQGSKNMPITFSSALPEYNLPFRGMWGGVIVLGKAPIAKTGGTNDIEGLPTNEGKYGGTVSDDNSGVMQCECGVRWSALGWSSMA